MAVPSPSLTRAVVVISHSLLAPSSPPWSSPWLVLSSPLSSLPLPAAGVKGAQGEWGEMGVRTKLPAGTAARGVGDAR